MSLTDEQLAEIKADLHQASGVIDSPDAQYNPAALTAMRRAEKLLAEVERLRAELAEAKATIEAQEVYRHAHHETANKDWPQRAQVPGRG